MTIPITLTLLRRPERPAGLLVVVPVDEVPLTEQGKPDRPAIRRLGAMVAA